MTTVPFAQIPTNTLQPFFYFEVDGSQASSATATYPVLIMGEYLILGSGYLANAPYRIDSYAQAIAAYGVGSIISRMVLAYLAQYPTGSVYCIGVAEPGAGAKAQGTFTIGGAATASGTLHLEIGGQYVPVPVVSGETAATVGGKLINASYLPDTSHLPVKRQNPFGGATVILEAKANGYLGNQIAVKINPKGQESGQTLPPGLTWTVTGEMGITQAGTGAPTLTTAIANIPSDTFRGIIVPWADDTTQDLFTAYLSDASGTWNYSRQLFGHCWSGTTGTVAERQTIGGQRAKDQHTTIVGTEGATGTSAPLSPVCPWEMAAAFAGQSIKSFDVNPTLPVQGLQIMGDATGYFTPRAPALADRDDYADRDSLLGDGIATVTYDRSGNVLLQRAVTCCTEDSGGNPFNSYQDAQTLYTLTDLILSLKSMLSTKFGRSALSDSVVTAIKGEIIGWYADMVERGLVERASDFETALVVQRNSTNRKRVDVLLPPYLVSQLISVATNVQFRL